MDGFDGTIAYHANDIVLDVGSPISATPTPEPRQLAFDEPVWLPLLTPFGKSARRPWTFQSARGMDTHSFG